MLFYRESVLDVLQLLEQYQSDAYAVKRSLTEMARHLRNTPMSNTDLRSHNFIPRICACVQPYTTSFTIVSCVCVLLERLFVRESDGELHQASVVTSGLWKFVEDAIKLDSTNIELHVMGCELISRLCLEQPHVPHVANQTEMVQGGILDFLYRAMQTHACSAMYVGAARAAANLVYMNALTAHRLLKTDLPQLFSMGLHTFFKDAAVVSAIAAVVFQLHVATLAKAQQSYLAWGCMDRVKTCLSVHVADVNTLYQLLRTLEIALRDNEAAKDAFCAKEVPFLVVTTFEEVVAAAARGSTVPHETRGPSNVAFLAFVIAVIFGHVAIMSKVSTPTGTDRDLLVRAKVQSLRTIAMARRHSRPSGARPSPRESQCPHVCRVSAHAVSDSTPGVGAMHSPCRGMYKPILIRAGALRCIKYIASTKTCHGGLQVLCRRSLAAFEA
ncbi:hypothetical protein, variant 2 [Aphanomyces invadans]|uniref:Uncharacterized protein n=1 Tax=Aphanomyces invadans TaxID=157072 RepID=A0A024TE06_9STRA|nr:hypothetical protein, variant 2 [Aphanomyces invadans]ETV91572.1 hypothetical protein, variant 2 [Aphanomyces invadans]|eukprot:XP_008879840.1 hypothetical protein, variant 2 [Aphanomyces invadans]